MANLTAPRDDSRQTGDIVEVDAGTNTIYHGGAVTIGADGFAHAGAASEPFVGVAQETVTGGGLVRVATEGVVSMNCLAAVGVQANVGKWVVLTDDNTVAISATVGKGIGVITKVESTTSVRVKLNVGLATA